MILFIVIFENVTDFYLIDKTKITNTILEYINKHIGVQINDNNWNSEIIESIRIIVNSNISNANTKTGEWSTSKPLESFIPFNVDKIFYIRFNEQ